MLPDDYSEGAEKPIDRRIANLKPFVAGQSGNPLGRPPGSKNRATIAKEFAKIVTGGLTVGGEICPNMTAEELVISALFRKAFDGDMNAIKELQDTLYGKITDKQEVEVKAEVSTNQATQKVLGVLTDEQLEVLNAGESGDNAG